MLSLSSSGLLRSTAVDYKVINKLLLSTCSFCVLVLWFLLALFHFYFTSHREIFCWFTAFDLTGRAGCKNVCDHPSFPKYKVKPYRVKYRKHSKAGYGFGWAFNVWVWGFFEWFSIKNNKNWVVFFSSSNHFSTAMRDIDLTQNGKNIKHFAWKQRPTHKYSSLCVVPFESPDTLIKLKKNYLTVCNVIKALLAPSVAMFTQRCSHIKAHEHSKWSFVSRGPVRTEYFYQHCPWSLTVCSGRTSVCTLCPQFRRGWPNKSL